MAHNKDFESLLSGRCTIEKRNKESTRNKKMKDEESANSTGEIRELCCEEVALKLSLNK